MKNPASPIADFYPTTFAIDMEGKRAEWEGVVLICFIDEQRLLRAEASIPQGSLTAEERARNKLGDILIYSHDDGLKDGVAPCFTFLPFSHKIKFQANNQGCESARRGTVLSCICWAQQMLFPDSFLLSAPPQIDGHHTGTKCPCRHHRLENCLKEVAFTQEAVWMRCNFAIVEPT